ncbi:sigma-54-dependent Fis family transcriptional regulator [Achromobacter aegrifaciens]|uniref:Acetoin catabolism regulatory protein n=1 Tax=Achromobacter aegrifaciens TaxID=1287736 RepID=A0AAD2KLR7_ACHAE|nr:sigma-54-dependent Fis family transcriptional regulator [Achromobacter aegrifaciens]CUJ68894.1 Acetoin catabolism regulatory protein [Achromobacter aegrifaciens]
MGQSDLRMSRNDFWRTIISKSHARCEGVAGRESRMDTTSFDSPCRLNAAIKKSHTLLTYAAATVDNAYELVEGTGSAIAVTGPDGTILFSRSDSKLQDPYGDSLFEPGTCWSEAKRGTNAIGICLIERAGICVHQDEHYLEVLQSYSTCAVPIFDHQGSISGVLAVLSKCESNQLHTIGFIRTAALLVENRMLIGQMFGKNVLIFHPEKNNIETIKQCIAVFAEDGGLVGLNSSARNYLGLSSVDSSSLRFSDIFLTPFQIARERVDNVARELVQLTLVDGRRVFVDWNCRGSTYGQALVPLGESALRPNLVPSRPKVGELKLADLDTGDSQVRRSIEKAQRIIGLDLPLLIEGESGVGKEMFTRAFHNSGPRARGPFVAVNCAAIPEGLIESELFGYEEGAFTGAKRRGSVGRIVQANGGTLFLDEIGDMPLQLQGRLLRVLQERQVFPLGGTKPIGVDFSLICATHRNLHSEIRQGRFREDLYYRLNGLRVHLPALREREDLVRLVKLTAEAEGGGAPVEITPEVMEAFKRAKWPGNIRQLQMLLRTAVALAGPGNPITMEHLPDEFADAIDITEALGSASEFPPKYPAQAHLRQLAEIELVAIRRAIGEANGNISEAARMLGISRKTLYRKLEKIEAVQV